MGHCGNRVQRVISIYGRNKYHFVLTTKEPLALPIIRLCAVMMDFLFLIFSFAFFNAINYFVLHSAFSDWQYWFVAWIAPIIGYIGIQVDDWEKGTTAGHDIFDLYIIDEKTGETFSKNRMALREILNKFLLCGLLSAITFSIFFLVDSLMTIRDDRRTIHDRISGSLVVQRQPSLTPGD